MGCLAIVTRASFAHENHTNMKEKNIRLAFDVSLILKGVDALIEVVGGLLALFVSKQFIIDIATLLTRGELAEDPHDVIAHYLLQAAQNFSIGAQHFAAFYLIGHGVVKLWLVAGLLRGKLWYYPVALVIFTLFILYQAYLFAFTASIWLVAITIVDIVVVALTWHEWRCRRRM